MQTLGISVDDSSFSHKVFIILNRQADSFLFYQYLTLSFIARRKGSHPLPESLKNVYSNQLSDIQMDAYVDFLCIETLNNYKTLTLSIVDKCCSNSVYISLIALNPVARFSLNIYANYPVCFRKANSLMDPFIVIPSWAIS
jgi:hypothetical protein